MKKPLLSSFILLCLSISALTLGKENPVPDQQQDKQPLTKTLVYSEGELTLFSEPFPKSLNPIVSPSAIGIRLFSLLYEPLLRVNETTGKIEGNLADNYLVSGGGTTFEFTLDANARWSDRLPVSAQDISFTLEAIVKYSHYRFYFEGIKVEILSEDTIRFTTHQADSNNLLLLGSFPILPAHVYKGQDFKDIKYDFSISSGPYVIESIRDGVAIILKRKNYWWPKELNKAMINTDVNHMFWVFSPEMITNKCPTCPSYFWPTDPKPEADNPTFPSNYWHPDPQSFDIQ